MPKTVSVATAEVDASPGEIYDRVSNIGNWNSWRSFFVRLIAKAGGEKAQVGDSFGTVAPVLLGILPLPVRNTVTKANGKEFSYTSEALFGAIKGNHTISLKKVGGVPLFGGRTEVSVRNEVEGLGAFLVPGPVQERAAVRWILDLKGAAEPKVA